jgi:hypothetical protein
MAVSEVLQSIDSTEAGKKLNLIRRYHTEILMLVFAGSIGFLYNARERDNEINTKKIESLNEQIRQYIDVDRKTAIKQNFETNQTLIEIKNILLLSQKNE